MKLRNKKTGQVVEAYSEEAIDLFIYLGTDEEGYELNHKTYRSIAELCEEWEVYGPKEPLIKDEKIRKIVRSWAEVNGISGDVRVFCSVYFNGISHEGISIEFDDAVFDFGDVIEKSKLYTIDELCGEDDFKDLLDRKMLSHLSELTTETVKEKE